MRFLARNSLLIMLLHMPIFIALNPVLAGRGWPYGARVAVELLICLPLLAWVSAGIVAAVKPQAITARILHALIDRRASRGIASRGLASLEPR
jgi:fucose 4-O-acetylase-like acetyltransferase